MPARSLASFILLVAAWLVPMFSLWWLATPILAWPVGMLSQLVTRVGFGDVVQSVEQHGGMVTFVTSLKPAGTGGDCTPNAGAVLQSVVTSRRSTSARVEEARC